MCSLEIIPNLFFLVLYLFLIRYSESTRSLHMDIIRMAMKGSEQKIVNDCRARLTQQGFFSVWYLLFFLNVSLTLNGH